MAGWGWGGGGGGRLCPRPGSQGLLLMGDEEASWRKCCASVDLRVERKHRDHLI